MNKDHLLSGIIKTVRSFAQLVPIVVGMLLLTSLVISVLPLERFSSWFGQQPWLNVLLGASVGSIAAAHPLASYLLGGELLKQGVSLFAVTALLVSWVTVGVIQLPAEMLLLGKRFAIYRNLTCFVLAIVVALVTVYTLRALSW
ncbi:MAG: hypothetical protein AMS22_02165 [Thiotrichales bacterium SG8_50]|nr:MAG: hypothetical protein AMS22_02165 [Thiotrichales bacterium SG8_50]